MALFQKERLQELILQFAGKRVLVVGDMIVDRYVSITARKLSREAPVPVGDLQGEKLSLGGAGNLASNIIALGGKADVLGFVGNDAQGEWIKKTLSDQGVDSTHIGTYDRPTTLKSRYIVNGSQVLRVDREVRSDTSTELSDGLLKSAERLISGCDIVAVADYDKGAITSYFIDSLVTFAKTAGKRIIAQPKVRHYMDLRSVDYIKSNEREASIATGISVLNESGLKNIATNLTTRLECKSIILTRSERGITVFEQNQMATIPPLISARQFARPVGVRDAMTSAITLSLACGSNSFEAAALGNLAAAIPGESAGTMVISAKDISQNLESADRILARVIQQPVRR
ncbi:MAG TPA: PfkB family carbohydrate kinase [Nitrososphaerales archaeon]|nr:PfkB family carbohydrate kinase [Nitrososphaerales archaeon]